MTATLYSETVTADEGIAGDVRVYIARCEQVLQQEIHRQGRLPERLVLPLPRTNAAQRALADWLTFLYRLYHRDILIEHMHAQYLH